MLTKMENSIARNSSSSRGICHHLQAVHKDLRLDPVDPADPADLKVVVLAVADRTLADRAASVALVDQASVALVDQASAALVGQASAAGASAGADQASADPVRKDAANPAADPNALSGQNNPSLPFANIKNARAAAIAAARRLIQTASKTWHALQPALCRNKAEAAQTPMPSCVFQYPPRAWSKTSRCPGVERST
jgi:hypothetical protein